VATAYFFSSEIDKKILYFFFKIRLTVNLVLPNSSMYGLPLLLLFIDISLKAIPFEMPVPKALEKASLAANFLA